MKYLVISAAILASLSGCVVAPARPYAAVQVQPEVVYYPQYETAYVWDPVATSFFFVYGGHRHYMDRGWHPRHGYPRGYYRR